MHHILGEFLSGHIHKGEVESLCVPIHYHLKDTVGNDVSCWMDIAIIFPNNNYLRQL